MPIEMPLWAAYPIKEIELFSAPGCRKVVPEEDPGEKDEKDEHEVSSQDNEVS